MTLELGGWSSFRRPRRPTSTGHVPTRGSDVDEAGHLFTLVASMSCCVAQMLIKSTLMVEMAHV